MDLVIGIVAFGVFVVLWAAFGFALVASQGSLDAAWASLRDLPTILQAIVGLLLLPVVAGLWIWETSWPMLLRVVLVAGLAWVNLYTFFPRDLLGGRM